MAQIITNIISLAIRSKTRDALLYDAILELDDDTTITVHEFEYDPKTDIFMIEATNGKFYPIHASKMGLADNTDLVKPAGTRQKFKNLKKPE